MPKKMWTRDEDIKLQELSPKMSYKDLAKHFNRTILALKVRTYKLGLKNLNAHKLWSTDEIARATELYSTKTLEETAKELHRNPKSVLSKFKSLGIRKRVARESLRKRAIEIAQNTDFPLHVIASQVGVSRSFVQRTLKEVGIKRNVGLRKTYDLLKGFHYNGNGHNSENRMALLYVYHNTCWDCKRTFVSENDLQIHHDYTRLPVQVVVLCKVCHGKRHNKRIVGK